MFVILVNVCLRKNFVTTINLPLVNKSFSQKGFSVQVRRFYHLYLRSRDMHCWFGRVGNTVSGIYAVQPINFRWLYYNEWYFQFQSYQNAYTDRFISNIFLGEFRQFTSDFAELRTVYDSANCFPLDTSSHSAARFWPIFCRIFTILTIIHYLG